MTTNDPNVAVDERDDNPNDSTARRLEKVASIIGRGNARLDRITAGLQSPPDGDKPGIRTALGDITAAANDAIAKANALLRRL